MEDLNFLFAVPNGEANYQLADPYLVNYYNDRNRRTIMLTSEIDDSSYDIIQMILNWNEEDKNIDPLERKPIKLVIASPGGTLEVAQAICSIIELSETPIWGIGIGCVASAASLIYLACHKRFVLPNCYFILHRGSLQNLSGNYNEIVAAIEDWQIQIEIMSDYYVNHTLYTRDEIDEGTSGDWYVRGREILEKGIAHSLISDMGIFLN